MHGIDTWRAYTAKELEARKSEADSSVTASFVSKRVNMKDTHPDPLRRLFLVSLDSWRTVVEYKEITNLRDTEQVLLLEESGIDTFVRRKVPPSAPYSWYVPDRLKINCKMRFVRTFYQPQPL